MIDQADLCDINAEHVVYRYEAWILSGHSPDAPLREFVEWCRGEDEHDLHAPRCPDGKSFYQRREESKQKETR